MMNMAKVNPNHGDVNPRCIDYGPDRKSTFPDAWFCHACDLADDYYNSYGRWPKLHSTRYICQAKHRNWIKPTQFVTKVIPGRYRIATDKKREPPPPSINVSYSGDSTSDSNSSEHLIFVARSTWNSNLAPILNGTITSKFFRNTQKGGGGGKGNHTNSKLMPIAKWLQRRAMWLCYPTVFSIFEQEES